MPQFLFAFRELAGLGVTCFFILSGFLITGLLCDEEAVTGGISLKEFYIRRTLRIMPAYYVMLLVTFCLALLKLVTDVPWYTFAICAIYLRDFAGRGMSLGHTWSLSLEEQFYLVWPFTLRKIPQPKRIPVALAVCLSVTIWRAVAILIGVWQPYNRYRPDFQFDSILIGCLIALVWTYKPELLKAVTSKAPAGFLLFICACAWTVSLVSVQAVLPIFLTGQIYLLAPVVSQLVANNDSPFARFLTNPILRWFGKVSYSLYLWQELFLTIKEPSWGILRAFPLNLVCLMLVACASYYFIERPVLALRKG